MDEKALKNYCKHWEVVNEFEINERRNSSIDIRWKQLNYIFGLALSLGFNLDKSLDEIEIARNRWSILKGSSL